MSSFIDNSLTNYEQILTPKGYDEHSSDHKRGFPFDQAGSVPTSTRNLQSRQQRKLQRNQTNESYNESQLNVIVSDQVSGIIQKRYFCNSNDIISSLKTGEIWNCILCSTNPIENYCNVCEKSFCKQCITEWLARNNSCPHCRYKCPIMEDVYEIAEIRRIQQKLLQDQLRSKYIDRAFRCEICKLMMTDPISCSRCNHNFCKRCFQNKQMKENKCPHCNQYDPKLKQPHKSLLEILDRACVNCRYCKEANRYHHLIDHEIKCRQEKIKKYKAATNNGRASRARLPPLNLSASKMNTTQSKIGNSTNNKRAKFCHGQSAEDYNNNPFNARLNTVSGKDPEKSDNSDNITFSNLSDNMGNNQQDQSMQSFEQQYNSFQRERITSQKQSQMNLNKYEEQNQSLSQRHDASTYSNPVDKLKQDSSDQSSSPCQSFLSENENEDDSHLYDDEEGILDAIQSPQIRESAARLRSSSEFKLRMSKDMRTSCTKELGHAFGTWIQTSRDNMDIDNCSSNSWSFYCMLFISGAAEMFLTACLFFDYYLIPLKEGQNPLEINTTLFMIGVTIEVTYLLFALPILTLIYLKSYGLYQSAFTNFWIIWPKSLLQLLPSEMLIFFGYDGNHTYEQVMLNLSWMRRLISSLRIIIQLLAFENLINSEFVTLVSFANFFYLTLLLVAICPQTSSYDQFSWYRRI